MFGIHCRKRCSSYNTFVDIIIVFVACSYVGACVHEGQLHPLTEVREYDDHYLIVLTLTTTYQSSTVHNLYVSSSLSLSLPSQYINGGTLEDLLHDSSMDLPWPLRIQLSLDIARGMEYLHLHNMLHRDLNSHNVLLRKQGSKYTGVVADFGLAAKNPRSYK